MKKSSMSYKRSSDSWQMKIHVKIQTAWRKVSGLRLPFPIPWLFIGGIIFGLGYLVVPSYKENAAAIWQLAMKSILIAAIGNAVVFFEILLDNAADTFPKLLDEDQQKAEGWVRHWYTKIFWSKTNILCGVFFGSVLVLGKLAANFTITAPLGWGWYRLFLSFIVGFVGGSMLWTMYGIAGLTASLGEDVKIRPSLFDSRTSAVRSASSILWKVSIVSATIYAFGVSQSLFCPTEVTEFGKILKNVFGVFIILYFIIPQINIHKTLVHLKQDRLTSLVKQIDSIFDEVANNPTPEKITQLRELFDVQQVVNGKRSWSFGALELITLVGTVVVPFILLLINCLLKNILKLVSE